VTGLPVGTSGPLPSRTADLPPGTSDPPPGGGPGPSVVGPDDLVRAVAERHGDELWHLALRYGNGDRQLAEELVQETLVRAWQHPDALDGSHGSPRAWLHRVLRNLAIDHHRRRQRRPVTTPFDADRTSTGTEAGDDGAGPSTTGGIDDLVDGWLVRAALEQLSDAHRQVLALTVGAGLSVAEAARALGVPEGTVKSRTYYALAGLRLALEELGYFP
jgi:RNA polymerase sigma-70 factor (ECF subfamily)